LRRISSRCSASGDDVVEHAREYAHDFAEFFPIEVRVIGEGIHDELRQIDGAEQARAVRGQGLLAAGVRGANIFAPPVIVHLVDAIDQHEAGLREIVRRGHDHIPHAARRQRAIHTTRHEAAVVGEVVTFVRPFTPDHLRGVTEIEAFLFRLATRERERELPRLIGLHRVHELIGDQQRQVELAQPAVLALRADEIHGVGMTDIEGAHLRAPPTARGRHRETHLVVDIHERQRAGRVSTCAAHVGPTRSKRRKFVADATTGLQREPCLVHLVEDVMHRIADRAGHGAIDRRCGGLVILRACVRGNAPGGNRAALQSPQESFVPLASFGWLFHGGERLGNALESAVDVPIDGLA